MTSLCFSANSSSISLQFITNTKHPMAFGHIEYACSPSLVFQSPSMINKYSVEEFLMVSSINS